MATQEIAQFFIHNTTARVAFQLSIIPVHHFGVRVVILLLLSGSDAFRLHQNASKCCYLCFFFSNSEPIELYSFGRFPESGGHAIRLVAQRKIRKYNQIKDTSE